ncbi:MAG: hypothetical protein KC621_22125 [Myxococcales bacterium]|nr:hypothetical protein [Myxococcales bacterium]
MPEGGRLRYNTPGLALYIEPAATPHARAKRRSTASNGLFVVALGLLLGGCIDTDVGPLDVLVGAPIPTESCTTTCDLTGGAKVAAGQDGLVEIAVTVDAPFCVVPSPDSAAWAGDVGFILESDFDGTLSAQACDADSVDDCTPLEEVDAKLFLIQLGAGGSSVCDTLRPSDFAEGT